jgi:F-type H+-transporting ATPase subunit b
VRRAGVLLAATASVALLPELALAASGGEAEGGWGRFWEWANLLLLIGALVYFGRKPISSFLTDRRGAIERDLHGADQLLRDSEARLAEWSGRAARLESEIADIKRAAREAAEQDSARILADAHAVAERIRRDAAGAVEREAQRARRRLREETAELAVKSAERVLVEQIQPADGERLFDEFVTRIEQAPPPASRS